MSDETINPDFLPGDSPDDGGSGQSNGGISKEVIERELGKTFPDEATALKAIKDTFNYVGKAGKIAGAVTEVMRTKGLSEDDAIAFIKSTAATQPQKMDMSGFVSREEFNQNNFFSKNPDLEPYRGLLNTYQKANPGKTIDEIATLPEVKGVIDKAISHDTIEKQKSVLHSNPKLGVVTDKMTKAREAQTQGNSRAAAEGAVDAVMDAFGI